ncbi:ArsR family transcriptional regulator [Candidatus Pacearchaeota archaeon]|nr:ArsR family transcriptional regulator [Candidatus Pacearchaeota archaeon]
MKNIRKIKTISKISEIDIEKNIIEYKTKKGKFGVKNPKIPIKDSQESREIIIHMMCDGCFSSGYAAYYNVGKETKEEFVKELRKVFGNIGYKIHKDSVHFSSAVMWILKEFFDVDFNSKKCRVPQKFFKGNRKKLIGIVRAIIIDEGTIDGSNIRLDSCNQKFLEDIKKICLKLGYSCGKIWQSKGPIFRFNILAKSIAELKKDMEKLPIHRKQILIEMVEKNQKREWEYKLPGEIKKKIIKSLLNNPKRKIELILALNLPKTTIGSHLRWLIKKEIVKYNVKKKH